MHTREHTPSLGCISVEMEALIRFLFQVFQAFVCKFHIIRSGDISLYSACGSSSSSIMCELLYISSLLAHTDL